MNIDDILKKVLGLFRRGLALAALVGFLIFAGLGWYFESWIVQQTQETIPQIIGRYAGVLFLIGVLMNLTAACLIYWTLSEKIFRDFKALENEADQNAFSNRVASAVEEKLSPALVGAVQTKLDDWKESRVEEFGLINEPPWDRWIKEAKMIEICVQGWEDWVTTHSGAWIHFFKSGGTVKLFLPNPEDPETLKVVQQRLPDRDASDQKAEIKNTYRRLKLAKDSGGNGKIIHHQLRKMNWYCAVRFDEKILFLSPYEHVRVRQQPGNPGPAANPEPHVKSPSYKVPLQEAAHSHTSKWIKKEFDGLARPEYSAMIEHPIAGWDDMGAAE